MKREILILNGPNLNLIGTREPEIYGARTLDEVISEAGVFFPDLGTTTVFSNHEGELITLIQNAPLKFSGLIINAGALSHYSYALYDALRFIEILKVEVHISNVYKREPFRHISVISAACDGIITGLGTDVYELALHWLHKRLKLQK